MMDSPQQSNPQQQDFVPIDQPQTPTGFGDDPSAGYTRTGNTNMLYDMLLKTVADNPIHTGAPVAPGIPENPQPKPQPDKAKGKSKK